MKTQIIPQIKQIELKGESFEFKCFSPDKTVLERLKPTVVSEIFAVNEKADNCDNPKYIFFKQEDMKVECYKISARKDKIEISAGDTRGLMYALFTLSELAVLNDGKIAEFDAIDEPALPLRGLSDDISRGQISTIQNFFDIIKRLARYKYNTYMPYIEDVFSFESIPAWGRYSQPLKKEEWVTIIEYAKDYQMDVRPILNLLGHFDKSAYIEELQPLALKLEDGTAGHVMDPKNPQVRETIIKILDEIIDTFGEGIIHAGGDEPVDLTKVYGVEEGGSLFIEHYTFIANELKKRNCTLMMYADFFAPPWGDYAVPVDRAREIPDGTEFVFWDYAVREDYPFVSALHEQKLRMYISPGSWSWKRFACDIKMAFNNTKGLLKADNGRSLGMIMSSWADQGDTLRELAWPGVIIGANFCWSANSEYSYDDIYNIYHKSFFGFEPDEAALLETVYHHDYLVKRDNEHEFKLEMFADPFEPIGFVDKANIGAIQTAMVEARKDIKTLTPKRNIDAFNGLLLTVERAAFTADKIAFLPHERIKTVEEGILYSQKAMQLAADLLLVKELHKKLWFDCNRASEWDKCAIYYDDQYDRLRMFARNIGTRNMFITYYKK